MDRTLVSIVRFSFHLIPEFLYAAFDLGSRSSFLEMLGVIWNLLEKNAHERAFVKRFEYICTE